MCLLSNTLQNKSLTNKAKIPFNIEQSVRYLSIMFKIGQSASHLDGATHYRSTSLQRMKKALALDGKLIEAEASSPAEARCPYCSGKMVLRQRRQMDRKKVTYFWRHIDNRNLYCSGRARPVS